MAKRNPPPNGVPPAPKPARVRKAAPTATVAPRVDSAADAASSSASVMTASDSTLAGNAEVPVVLAGASRQSEDSFDARATSPNDNEIRERAYHRFLERGGQHGQDWDDWLAAEAALRKR